MKKSDFNKIKDKYYKKYVSVTKNDNNIIIGKYDSEIRKANIIYIDNQEVMIKDIKTIELYVDKKLYKYVSVVYLDLDYDHEYSYRTDIKNIAVGNLVSVDRQGSIVTAEVVGINFYTRDNAPYPVEKTKKVLSIVGFVDYKKDDENIYIINESYKLSYNILEQRVVNELKKYNFTPKQCLYIILLLRSNKYPNSSCYKMLDYFKQVEDIKLKSIHFIANLLSNPDNKLYRVNCPLDDNNIYLIDCLHKSDNIDLNEKSKKKINICHNCKWYNPIIEENLNNDPIDFTYLNDKEIKKIYYDDVIAISIAQKKSLGCPGNIELITLINKKLKGYQTNFLIEDLDDNLYKIIPWLNDDYSYNSNYIDEGWKLIDLGFNNHLFIRNFLYNKFIKIIIDKEDDEIYNSWKNWIKDIVSTTKYVKPEPKMKNIIDNESIYGFINRNISNNKLPYDFSLKYFKHYNDNGLIIADGFLEQFTKMKVDSNLLKKLKRITKLLDDNTIELCSNMVDTYYLNNDNLYYGTFDAYLKLLFNNYKEKKSLIEFAIHMITSSKEIETVKIGISILNLFIIDENDDLGNCIKQLALVDEFTLYCDYIIDNFKNANEIKFDLIKKVYGYGKLVLIGSIEITSKEIETWLFRYGCNNKVNDNRFALYIANKLDLPKILNNNFTKDDIKGLYTIIKGLLDEDNFSFYKDKEKLIDAIIKLKNKFSDDIKYLYIVCLIKEYIELNMKDSLYYTKIKNILNKKDIQKILCSSIKVGKYIDETILISLNIEDIDIYDQVFKVFKLNVKKGYKKQAISVINYLFNRKDNIHNVLDYLNNNLDFSSYLNYPDAIIDPNNNDLAFIIDNLYNYPLEGIEFIKYGLQCQSMLPRKEALKVISHWLSLQDKSAKEYLPIDLYDTLLELRNNEVVFSYRECINEILGIEEDLSKSFNPKVIYAYNDPKDTMINIKTGYVNKLFNKTNIINGRNYYMNNLITAVKKRYNSYTGYVESDYKHYFVKILVDKNDNIVDMSCNCPNSFQCEHEYALITYIRINDDIKEEDFC